LRGRNSIDVYRYRVAYTGLYIGSLISGYYKVKMEVIAKLVVRGKYMKWNCRKNVENCIEKLKEIVEI